MSTRCGAMSPRVAFFSISDRPQLSQITHAQLSAYCKHHGYSLTLHSSTLDPSRHIAWSKVVLLRSAMRKPPLFDLYVWVDDDILITSPEVPFERLLEPYSFDHALLSEDVSAEHPLNTGIIVLRNTASPH